MRKGTNLRQGCKWVVMGFKLEEFDGVVVVVRERRLGGESREE